MPEKLSKSEQARMNGSKSKGPTTPAGKAASSKNALKHGFAAAQNLLLDSDDTAAFAAHLAGYRSSYRPTNYVEHEFVEKLASISWRQSRLVAIETHLLDYQISLNTPAVNRMFPVESADPYLHLTLAWLSLARKHQKAPPEPKQDGENEDTDFEIDSIELIRRYQTSLDRQFRNTLLSFRQYRKDFAPQSVSTAAHPEPRTQPEIPQIRKEIEENSAPPNEPNEWPASPPTQPFDTIETVDPNPQNPPMDQAA